MRNLNVRAACAVLFAAMAGCGPTVVPPTTHAPTTPDQVNIYAAPPQEYQVLGMINVPISNDVRWDDKGDANLGFERLKAAAAAQGANGVLLVAPNDPLGAHVMAGYQGKYYQVPLQTNPKAAVAEAIWVVKEK